MRKKATKPSAKAAKKKKHYEKVLQRELDGLDDEFGTLKFLAQELQVRADSIRFQKVAYKI